MKIIVAALLAALFASRAFAQTGTQNAVTGTAAVAKNCAYLGSDANGNTFCAAVPSGGGGIATVTNTSCDIITSVSGSTLTISNGWRPEHIAAARGLIATDNCMIMYLTGAALMQMGLPAVGTAPFTANNFMFCFVVEGAGVQWTGAPIENGPTSYPHNASGCLHINENGAWSQPSFTPFYQPQ